MKFKPLAALALTAALLTGTTSAAWNPVDFAGGALSGILAEEDGTMLVTDVFNKVIWQVSDQGVRQAVGRINMTDLSGEPIGLCLDGALNDSFFTQPWAVAPYLDGYAVTDTAANKIRYFDETGVYTVAGSGKAGDKDGAGSKAAFDGPTGLVSGDKGRLYIADTGNGAIRVLRQTGQVSTLLSGLNEPTGLCWHDGSLYVAETGRNRILVIRDGVSQVLAGESGAKQEDGAYAGGYQDGPALTARFDHPQGIAVGADGTVYVADTGNHAIRAIADGRVSTVDVADQTPRGLAQPRGLLVQGDTLYVTDLLSQTVNPISIAPIRYDDVADSAWYASMVHEATRRGLAGEMTPGKFAPDTLVTRAGLVEMLANLHTYANGGTVIDGAGVFTDVAADAPYAAAVRWAAENGVVAGTGDGTFRPDAPVTREQLATILYQYARYAGHSLTVDYDVTLANFPDGGAVSAYARETMAWAVDNHILSGYEDGTLRPAGNATRAQTVTMLLSVMELFEL